ncbi:uncharacterized protein LOC129760504 [Uranotaenia lowii]|uniref:uncharacterized protein LOC129760504 n=1 Tax=Uranotaenia lowii TaxID=190385 RepID=UPI00247A0176|nr:uncharacterized protein LOC129760504 [Uranotaenia lowii]
MSTTKTRGKSAIHINESIISSNSSNTQNTLLKIESVVPKLTSRVNNAAGLSHSNRLKTFHRSHSTLSSSYLKKISDKKIVAPKEAIVTEREHRNTNNNEPQPDGCVFVQNGSTIVKRSDKDREKHPDRINLDRKGLGAIPIIDDEPNLRLLSLQHNLINVFSIPTETDSNNNEAKQTAIPQTAQVSGKAPVSGTTYNNPAIPSNATARDTSISNSSNSPTAMPTTTANHQSHTASRTAKQFLRQKSTSRNQLYVNNNYMTGKTTLASKPLNGFVNGQSPTSATSPTNAFLQKPSSILLNAQHRNLLKKSNSFISNATLFPTPPSYQQTASSIAKLKNKLLLTPSFSIDSLNSLNETNIVESPSNNNSGKTTPTCTAPTNGTSYTHPQNHISPILSAAEPRYNLQNLVFLDLYDNQIEKISCLDGLKCITVLLLGKNRISDISGLTSLRQTLRVLDLHGNKISNISSKINQLQELKSLNLAGNQLRQIHAQDFSGLVNLKELNLKRNRLKKIHGFDDLRSLERLWLCHNDLQCVEDMSAIAKAINLKEVTIENNPVSLAGDCVSFLVSYLPGLVSLSQMQITEQVRRAASAWRKNKELSDLNYTNLTTDVCHNIRREEIISNARTNWELLRSQQSAACRNVQRTANGAHASIRKEVEVEIPASTPDSAKEIKLKKTSNITGTNTNNINRSRTPKRQPAKKVTRSSSQDNSGSQVSEQDAEEYFRLPPILAPFLEQNTPAETAAEKVESSESSAHHADSSVSSALSTDDEEAQAKLDAKTSTPTTPETKDTPEEPQSDQEQIAPSCPTDESNNDKLSTLSTLSSKTASDSAGTVSSASDFDQSRHSGSHAPKSKVGVPTKRYGVGTLSRTNTARSNAAVINNVCNLANTSNLATQSIPNSNSSNNLTSNVLNPSTCVAPTKVKVTEREREQGGDYLIEICGRYLNVYGLGALKFIDKQWNMTKAGDVNTVKFSYINFNNITAILCRIKIRFVNAENFIFKETNITCLGQINALAESQGIASLTIDPEGNPIASKSWRNYAIYRLSHWGLKHINGIEITEDEIHMAEHTYSGLSDLVLWSLPEILLQPLLQRLRLEETVHASKMTAKEWLMQADSSLKNVVGKEALQWKKHSVTQDDIAMRGKGKVYFARMLDNTCNAVDKLQQLDSMWPALLVEMVRNTLIDYSQIDVYVRNLMMELLK